MRTKTADLVSTHSRPKAAGYINSNSVEYTCVSTHSRPKAAGHTAATLFLIVMVSTHSRPKAAGRLIWCKKTPLKCFNTQPPEGGWVFNPLRKAD